MTTKTTAKKTSNEGPADLANMFAGLAGPAKKTPAKKTPVKDHLEDELHIDDQVELAAERLDKRFDEAKPNRHEDDPRVQAVKAHFKTELDNDTIYEVVKRALTPKGAIAKFDVYLCPALATIKIDADPRVVAVKEYAKATTNYETGWDIVVETMSNQDIYEVVKKTKTPAGAIRKMAAHVGVHVELEPVAETLAETKIRGAVPSEY